MNEGYSFYNNDQLINEIYDSKNDELNISLETVPQNRYKYIEDDNTIRKGNLLNEFNNRQFKSNYFSFENSLTDFKYYKQKKKIIIENKLKIQNKSRLLLKQCNFVRLYKYVYFSEQGIGNEFEELRDNDQTKIQDYKKEDASVSDNMNNLNKEAKDKKPISTYNFRCLFTILTNESYYNFIFLMTILKFYNNNKRKLIVQKEACYLYNKENNGKEFTELTKDIKLLNEEIEVDSTFLKFVTLNGISNEEELHSQVQILGEKFNKQYIYLLNFIHLIYSNPLFTDTKLYLSWKIQLGQLVAAWDFQRKLGITTKYSLKTLVLKCIIEKLFNAKEKGKVFNFELQKRQKDSNILDLIPIEIVATTDNPRLSFVPDGQFTIVLCLIFDISLWFTFIIMPIIFILKIDILILNVLNILGSCVYFLFIIKRFRDMVLDNMSNLEKDLNKAFYATTQDIYILIDLLTVIPFDILFSEGTPDNPDNAYLIWKFFWLLRFRRVGQSVIFLEKTKYAVELRLLILLAKFILVAQWMGLFFYRLFESELISKLPNIKDNIYMNSLYIGGYILPGKSIISLDIISSTLSAFQFTYVFFAFFLGQIITANVFSNVSDIIKSMNESENRYMEIWDDHRLIDHFFKLDQDTSNIVQSYYQYIWLKHREAIYGRSLFGNLSKKMKYEFNLSFIPSYEILIQDFMLLSSSNNKFVTYTVSVLQKYIGIPYERLCVQGKLIKGLFFLYNGTVYCSDELNKSSEKDKKGLSDLSLNKDSKKRLDLEDSFSNSKLEMQEILKDRNSKVIKKDLLTKEHKTMFPIDSLFIKTGRAVETVYCKTYCDLFLIPLKVFDENFFLNFRNEMHKLSNIARKYGEKKIGNDSSLLRLILEHSSRSKDHYYEERYTTANMWIKIMFYIPQFKINSFSTGESQMPGKQKNKIKIFSHGNSNHLGLNEINQKTCLELALKLIDSKEQPSQNLEADN